MLTMNSIDKAIKAAGGVVNLANTLGVSQSTVSMWRNRKRVSAEQARAVSIATGGAVTVYELRPDVFGDRPEQVA